MRSGFEVRAAYLLGIMLPVLETARRRSNFDDLPGYIDDFIPSWSPPRVHLTSIESGDYSHATLGQDTSGGGRCARTRKAKARWVRFATWDR
jgi:hypothetical protein